MPGRLSTFQFRHRPLYFGGGVMNLFSPPQPNTQVLNKNPITAHRLNGISRWYQRSQSTSREYEQCEIGEQYLVLLSGPKDRQGKRARAHWLMATIMKCIASKKKTRPSGCIWKAPFKPLALTTQLKVSCWCNLSLLPKICSPLTDFKQMPTCAFLYRPYYTCQTGMLNITFCKPPGPCLSPSINILLFR